jgi:hypothetical protein
LLAPELADSEGWAAHATAEIAGQAGLQVLGDGGGAEQAFAYEVFLLDMLLLATAFLDVRGHDVPAPVIQALRRAGGALALLLDGDEPDPAFGDADNGRAISLDSRAGRDGRGVAAAIASRLGDPGARRVARRSDTYAPLLFGAEGLARFAATVPGGPAGSGVLPDAGIVVIRSGGIRALLDAGPLGYLSIAAHGHADALSIALSAGEDELVSDPGTGSYLDPARRSWFRSTAAHATVTVDDRDQSEQGGAFLWLRHANARLLVWDEEHLVAVAEHDGYARLPDPVSHRRAIASIGGRALLVVDRLEARGTHLAAQNWPLHPEGELHTLAPGIVELHLRDVPRLLIALAATGEAHSIMDRDGLWSRRLEEWRPAPRYRQLATWQGVVHLAALLTAPDPSGALPRLRLEEEGGAVIARVSLAGAEHALRLELGSNVPVVEPVVPVE